MPSREVVMDMNIYKREEKIREVEVLTKVLNTPTVSMAAQLLAQKALTKILKELYDDSE
jgi:hypothetical protein